MDNSIILQKLQGIMRDVFNNNDIVPFDSMTAHDVIGWDSLGHVRLMVEIEEVFDIQFSATELSKLKNVSALVQLIQEKLK